MIFTSKDILTGKTYFDRQKSRNNNSRWFLAEDPTCGFFDTPPDGAALFYTSVKEEKNCDLLRRYLLHRIYGLPFGQKAFVMERDSVFVWVLHWLVSAITSDYSQKKNESA